MWGKTDAKHRIQKSKAHVFTDNAPQRGMLQKLHCQEAVRFACVSAMVLVGFSLQGPTSAMPTV